MRCNGGVTRVVALAVATILLAAPAATAKENVRARLVSRLALDARAGTTITVTWRLYVREHGERRPFDAGELFVRLRGQARGAATRAYGDGGNGRYRARIKVPRGGLAGIRFGLMGYRTYPGGTMEPAPVYFPLDNDPFKRP